MFSTLTRAQKWALAAGLLLASYAVAGFLVAPLILRSQAEGLLREQLGREVRIEAVRINPFALSASVHGFALPDPDGSEFVEFEELYVNFQLSSLFRQAITLNDVLLVSPNVHIKILPDGTLNFADLLELGASDEPEPEPSEDEDSAPPAVLVFLAKISGGKLQFSDRSLATPFDIEIAPLDVAVRDFGTRPDDEAPLSFTATTTAGEKVEVESQLSVLPVRASGRFSFTNIRPRTGWLYLQDSLKFEIVDGAIALEGEFEVDASDGLVATLDAGAIRVRDLEVDERATKEPVLTLPAFDIEGISVSYPAQEVRVASVSSNGLWLRSKRLEDGRLRAPSLAERIASEAEAVDEEADVSPARDEADGKPWEVAVDKISLEKYRLDFMDLSTPEPLELRIEPIALSVEGLSTKSGSTGRVDFSLSFEKEGTVAIGGDFALAPTSADLDVEVSEIDLSKFQPYVGAAAAVGVESGRFGMAGRVSARPGSEDEPLVRYQGGAQIAGLRTQDLALNEELASWAALSLEGLNVAVEPTSVHLRKLLLREPSARVVVRSDGVLNLAALAREDTEAATDAEAPPNETDSSDATAEPVPVKLDLIEIVGGSTSFSDRSIEPPFDAALEKLNVRVAGFSTDPAGRTQIHADARVNEAGALTVEGDLSPFAAKTSGAFKVDLHNLQLQPMTPYSGRYVGRSIEGGGLFLDLDYEIDNNQLVAANKVRVDKFTFGDAVESEDALDLPVGLAVGLLKDPKGQIKLDLPLAGSLDDPSFNLLGLIADSLTDLVTKAATAPFTLVAGLVGGSGEELQFIAFAPGSAELDAIQRAKLETVTSVLQQRPDLALGIAGSAAAAADGPGLQAAALEAQLRQRRFEELSESWFGEEPKSIDDITLEDEDYQRLLAEAYGARFGGSSSPDGLPAVSEGSETEQKAARQSAMEQQLREALPLDDTALADLANRRAATIRDWLSNEHQIGAERISLGEPDTGATPVDRTVHTPLSLTSL